MLVQFIWRCGLRTKEQNEKMRGATRDKILSASIALFAEKGLSATSVQDIAKRADVSVGLMYHYFKTKEEVFDYLSNLARSQIGELNDYLKGIECAVEAIRAIAKEFLDGFRAGYGFAQGMSILSQLGANQREFHESFSDAIASLIKRGQGQGKFKDGAPVGLAQFFIAQMHGLASMQLAVKELFCVPTTDMLVAYLIKEGCGV